MNLTASASAGRAPARKKPTPPSGSRSPGAAPGFSRSNSRIRSRSALVTPGRWPMVDLIPPQPDPQRLRRHPQLPGDRLDRRPLRGMLVPMLPHQPHRPLPQLVRVPRRSRHGSILSKSGASRIPGAVHCEQCEHCEHRLGGTDVSGGQTDGQAPRNSVNGVNTLFDMPVRPRPGSAPRRPDIEGCQPSR